MRCQRTRTLLIVVTSVSVTASVMAADAPSPTERELTPFAWTLEEARQELQLNPRDAYLQYVAMQLARAVGRQNEVAEQIATMRPRRSRRGRQEEIDLFKIFSGALAVQESLQLDTMVGAENPNAGAGPQKATIQVASLQGPTVESHPWKEMLGGKNPQVSPLSLNVPDDQYFIVFNSLNRLLDLLDLNDRWGAHLVIQAQKEARNFRVSERLKTQLAIQTDPLTRPFYDLVVEEVAATGSDLYVREGSDVTLLFQFKQPQVFKFRMDGFLTSFERSIPDARRSEGEHLGVKYVHVTSPDRRVHVYSAYPKANLHVRSNSIVGLKRVLATIKGSDAEGNSITRLGDTDEFKYIRTLMPRGAKEEDGLVYLSDPFIRRLTGPVVKPSTESPRNHSRKSPMAIAPPDCLARVIWRHRAGVRIDSRRTPRTECRRITDMRWR